MGPFAADPVRFERGRRLAREHEGEIRRLDRNTWSVPSSSGEPFTVKPHHGLCPCGDREHRFLLCKHIYAARIVRAERGA